MERGGVFICHMEESQLNKIMGTAVASGLAALSDDKVNLLRTDPGAVLEIIQTIRIRHGDWAKCIDPPEVKAFFARLSPPASAEAGSMQL